MIAYAALIDDQADLLRFNELVELYQEDMIRIARSVLYDHQLAEDAVQNALYGIAVSFKKIPSHDAKAVRVYMLSSAKHAALRLKKNEKKIETVGYSEIIDVSPEDNPTFEAIRQSDDYDQLLHAIEQLDEIYQDVLLHYYSFNQSVPEIAKLFGRKTSTVRQQLTRGRRLLEEICRKEGIIRG